MDVFLIWDRLAAAARSRCGRSERGASLVEYALLIALIALACIVAVTVLGTSTSTRYSSVGSALQ